MFQFGDENSIRAKYRSDVNIFNWKMLQECSKSNHFDGQLVRIERYNVKMIQTAEEFIFYRVHQNSKEKS